MINSAPRERKIVSINGLQRLKQALMKEGLITKDDLRVAEVAAQHENESLNKILVKLGFMTKEEPRLCSWGKRWISPM